MSSQSLSDVFAKLAQKERRPQDPAPRKSLGSPDRSEDDTTVPPSGSPSSFGEIPPLSVEHSGKHAKGVFSYEVFFCSW